MNRGVISYEAYEKLQICLGHYKQSVSSLEAQLEAARIETERWKAIGK